MEQKEKYFIRAKLYEARILGGEVIPIQTNNKRLTLKTSMPMK